MGERVAWFNGKIVPESEASLLPRLWLPSATGCSTRCGPSATSRSCSRSISIGYRSLRYSNLDPGLAARRCRAHRGRQASGAHHAG